MGVEVLGAAHAGGLGGDTVGRHPLVERNGLFHVVRCGQHLIADLVTRHRTGPDT